MKEFNFSKVAGLQPTTLLKIELLTGVFSLVFCVMQNSYFVEQIPVAGSVKKETDAYSAASIRPMS